MRGRVLVVDDDVRLCELLEADLSRHGFEVGWRARADEALACLAEEEFDVVLTDLRLPGSDGLEFCRRILERREDLPVLVMTAFGSLESAIGAIQAGAYDFVPKPVDSDLLALSLLKAVEHRGLRRKIRLLSEQLDRSDEWGELLGDSPPMRELRSQRARIAAERSSPPAPSTRAAPVGTAHSSRSIARRCRRVSWRASSSVIARGLSPTPGETARG